MIGSGTYHAINLGLKQLIILFRGYGRKVIVGL